MNEKIRNIKNLSLMDYHPILPYLQRKNKAFQLDPYRIGVFKYYKNTNIHFDYIIKSENERWKAHSCKKGQALTLFMHEDISCDMICNVAAYNRMCCKKRSYALDLIDNMSDALHGIRHFYYVP